LEGFLSADFSEFLIGENLCNLRILLSH